VRLLPYMRRCATGDVVAPAWIGASGLADFRLPIPRDDLLWSRSPPLAERTTDSPAPKQPSPAAQFYGSCSHHVRIVYASTPHLDVPWSGQHAHHSLVSAIHCASPCKPLEKRRAEKTPSDSCVPEVQPSRTDLHFNQASRRARAHNVSSVCPTRRPTSSKERKR
jgi:hypothetical protein